jgi:hypothetical protein
VDICSFDFLVTNITFSNLNSLGLSLLGGDMDPGWSMATLTLPLAGTNGLTNDTTSSPMLLLIVNIYIYLNTKICMNISILEISNSGRTTFGSIYYSNLELYLKAIFQPFRDNQ